MAIWQEILSNSFLIFYQTKTKGNPSPQGAILIRLKQPVSMTRILLKNP